MSNQHQVIIVGAGLAGLCCALRLKELGIPFLIVESSYVPGGRVATDELNGFLLDRGFQVLLTAYPEARKVLNYEALDLKPFRSGALVRFEGKFHKVLDPFQDPVGALGTISSPIGTLADKLKVAQLRLELGGASLEQLLTAPETSTLAALQKRGFSDSIIDRFFRPFFGGVFLERELSTSSRKFDFLFRMFADGGVAIPAHGMAQIAKQLAEEVGESNIRYNTKVCAVGNGKVALSTGETLSAPHIVMATSGAASIELLYDTPSPPSSQRGVTCLYFSADRSPIEDPLLVLNGDGKGVINNVCVPSDISPSYAPAGKSLISVSVLGVGHVPHQLEAKVRAQLVDWFGSPASTWQHLRTYAMVGALPSQDPPTNMISRTIELAPGLFVCGDHVATGSINGAMESGRLAATAIANKVTVLQGSP